MPLTTAAPPPAGIYWWAAIYASFSVTAASRLAMRESPRAPLHLYVTASIGMLPPQQFSLRASASLGMLVGTEETTAFGIKSTARLRMGQIPSTSFKLPVTASLAFASSENPGAPPPLFNNPAVIRAATI